VTRSIPCRECGGEGRVETSRFGGNDPDTWLISCDTCRGDAYERCCECGEPATDAWIEPGNSDYPERVFPLCAGHMVLYVEAAAE
jgi:hypothetical protein